MSKVGFFWDFGVNEWVLVSEIRNINYKIFQKFQQILKTLGDLHSKIVENPKNTAIEFQSTLE